MNATAPTQYNYEKVYKFLAFNDDQCSCDICGKQELKGTYALESFTTGEIIRAGSVCGARMLGWTIKEFNSQFRTQKTADKLDAQAEFRASEEYKADNAALEFLNQESDAIEAKIWNETDHTKRAELDATRRSMKSRLDYLQPFSTAKREKLAEILAKYNLDPKKTYIF